MRRSSRARTGLVLAHRGLLAPALLALSTALACEEEEDGFGCGECPPSGGSCRNGLISYGYDWSFACDDGDGCSNFTRRCALGCRDESITENDRELVYLLCEEASLRSPGFPCRHDIDCVSPIGANQMSRLLADAGSASIPTASAQLVCGASGVCETATAQPVPSDLGVACSAVTSNLHPEPIVAATETCASGACLMREGGAMAGTCTMACASDAECPEGYTCGEVLDGRYGTWGRTGFGSPPLRISACRPSVS